MKFYLVSASNDKFVCADDNLMSGVRVLAANRDNAGLWETYYAVAVEYSKEELQALAIQLKPYLNIPNGGGGTEPPSNDPSKVPFNVYGSGTYDLTKQSNCCLFTEECARRLHAMDPGWGLIKKHPGQEQCNAQQQFPHAIDAVWNKITNQAYDIIVNNSAPGAAPAWNLTGTPTNPADWFAPQ